MEANQISSLVGQAVLSLKDLSQLLLLTDGPGFDATKSQALITSYLARFKIWVGSLGAHRASGTRSLEYKLRDASLIRNHVVSLLHDLRASISEALYIIDPSNEDRNREPSSTSSTDYDPIDDELFQLIYEDDQNAVNRSELDQALGGIGNAIDCLLRLSTTIRNPAPHDHFKSRAGTELITAFVSLDKAHIRHKYPDISENLADRLAKCLARRRQYFKYREDHANRIGRGLDDEDGDEEKESQYDKSALTTTRTIISSLPAHLKDRQDPTPAFTNDFPEDDDVQSKTSYAPTEASSGELRVPNIPSEHIHGPFKCPYCHMITFIDTRYEWKKHVFGDLRPYSCLSETCSLPNQLFTRRSEWRQHMEHEHWRVWQCSLGCTGAAARFQSAEEFRHHSQAFHADELRLYGNLDLQVDLHLSSVRDLSKARQSCPLCNQVEVFGSDKEYISHVGMHLEHLALFVLPRVGDEDSGEGEHDGDTDQRSLSDEAVALLPEQSALPDDSSHEEYNGDRRYGSLPEGELIFEEEHPFPKELEQTASPEAVGIPSTPEPGPSITSPAETSQPQTSTRKPDPRLGLFKWDIAAGNMEVTPADDN